MIALIAGLTKNRIIGKDGSLPWHIPEDLRNFKQLTSGHTIIMGRKTYESIGRPLPNRNNIVVSRTMEAADGIEVCSSFEEAMGKARQKEGDTFIIGGTSMFAEGLAVADTLYLSWIKKDYEGNIYFPAFDVNDWKMTEEKDFDDFVFTAYKRK